MSSRQYNESNTACGFTFTAELCKPMVFCKEKRKETNANGFSQLNTFHFKIRTQTIFTSLLTD